MQHLNAAIGSNGIIPITFLEEAAQHLHWIKQHSYKSTDKSNRLTTTFLVTPTVIPRMPGIINYNRN